MAAKLRQEINIITGTGVTLAGIALMFRTNDQSSSAKVQIDTAKYSDALYYFEIVAINTLAADRTVKLRNGTTDYASITVPAGTTTPTRLRSASFSPIDGANDYFVFLPSGAVQMTVQAITAARVIVLQSATSITATQTQIEIGNEELGKVNTTSAALTLPKYWKYEAANWDGGKTFYIEVVWASSSTMDTTTIQLQKDGGSDNFTFTDDTAVVNAGTPSSANVPQRTRVAFTPTDGRNYRIATLRSSNMSTHDIHSAKIVVEQNGTGADVVETASYDNINAGSGYSVYAIIPRVGQSFKPDRNGAIDQAKLVIGKTGAPTGNCRALLYSHSGTYGSGGTALSLLATSDNVDVSTLPSFGTSLYTTFTFSGAQRYQMTKDTAYFILLEYTGGDALNNVGLTKSTANGAAGNGWSSFTGALTDDIPFYVYTSPLTKVEAEFLIVNTGLVSPSTGLKDLDTLYDPAEWDAGSGTIAFIHEAGSGSGASEGTADVKLQSDPNGTPADVTNSTITNLTGRERSSTMTMPGASATLDTNQTGSGTLLYSRILAQWVWSGVAPIAPRSHSYLIA